MGGCGRSVSRRWKTRHVPGLDPGIVQRAVVEILNAIYEEDFLDLSYGFRPGRGQHEALNALAAGINGGRVNWARLAKVPAAKPLESQTRAWTLIFGPSSTASTTIG
jgi:RNA-directed DNA polymerase